jgi:hypothetical protein
MPPQSYRYYCLDGMGNLHLADWIVAESDEDAIAQIEARHPDGKCEIWRGTQLIASTAPRQQSA